MLAAEALNIERERERERQGQRSRATVSWSLTLKQEDEKGGRGLDGGLECWVRLIRVVLT